MTSHQSDPKDKARKNFVEDCIPKTKQKSKCPWESTKIRKSPDWEKKWVQHRQGNLRSSRTISNQNVRSFTTNIGDNNWDLTVLLIYTQPSPRGRGRLPGVSTKNFNSWTLIGRSELGTTFRKSGNSNKESGIFQAQEKHFSLHLWKVCTLLSQMFWLSTSKEQFKANWTGK